MANKGGSGYIKRLNAPKYFAIHRKEHKYIIKQNPGRHSLAKSIALTVAVDKLGLAIDRPEAKKLIKAGLVMVNGKKILDPRFPIGLNDVVLANSEEHMVGINQRGQITLEKAEKGKQVYKVIGKFKYSGNSVMLRLHDGSIVKANADAKTDDSVTVANGKVSKVIKFGPGSKCEIIDGVHVGKSGKIKDVMAGNMHKTKSVIVEQSSGGKFETLVKNIIVVE
jgi:small subunit ribosomal protein S4e